MNRFEFETQIINKAFNDPAYHERLLKDPKGAISEELGKLKDGATLPDNVKVSVLQETPDQLYLVLPVNPKAAGEVDVSSAKIGVEPQSIGAALVAVVVADVACQNIYVTIQPTPVVAVVVD
ncbi:MAG: NHLP leader peptide family RiPP precursor [Rhodospirillaceae bacterium]